MSEEEKETGKKAASGEEGGGGGEQITDSGSSSAVSNETAEKKKMPPNEAEGGAKLEASSALTEDPVKVKFNTAAAAAAATTATNNDSTAVDIGAGESDELAVKIKSAEQKYPSLTKAELMRYATDPFWVRLRWILFILFWIVWVAMLVVAVVIIILAPKCPTPSPKQWWQKAPIYEVYAKSFKDSDGDGKGDLKGVESKLDYLYELGIGSIWLTPVYKSPMDDNGYDIEDFTAIDPSFGTLDDFKDLVSAMQERGLKLIMDFVPNHSSDKHEWFQKSIKKEEPYTDFYIWRDGTSSTPPNNWLSVFGGSAWEWNAERGQWYLHQFKKSQPDLNLRNPEVVERLKDVMRFWLDLGVDGFRFDAVAHMFEDEKFEDEPSSGLSPEGNNKYMTLEHTKTFNLPEVIELLAEFRQVLDEKTEGEEVDTYPRIMMTEAYLKGKELAKYYGTNITDNVGTISHIPLNFEMITSFKDKDSVSAESMKETIDSYLKDLPEGAWPNFVLGNHDNPRVSSRFGPELVDAMNMIVMLLPGTPITYYGEELGMDDLSMETFDDPRDPERSPMPWDSTENAGFTSGTPWLKINDDYKEINVAVQKNDSSPFNTHYKIYKDLAKMRHSDSILFGNYSSIVKEDLFAYSRVKKGNPGYIVAVNFGNEEIFADLSGLPNLSNEGTVMQKSFYSDDIISGPDDPDDAEVDPTTKGARIGLFDIPLKPKQGLLLSFVPDFTS